jgi:hypothetical protein
MITKQDYMKLQNDKDARAIVYHILEACNIFSPSFSQESARITAYEEGKRAVGIALRSDLNGDPEDLFVLMMSEDKQGLYKQPTKKGDE